MRPDIGDSNTLARIDQLADLLRPLPSDQVLDTLRPILNDHAIEPLIEYIGERLHKDEGEQDLTFHLSWGHLRRTEFGHKSVGNEELEKLAKVG
jgi:hypothetical protein